VCLGENLVGLKVVGLTQAAVAPGRLAARFDTVLGLAHSVVAGLGVGHLPCFIGDAWPGLIRLAPPDPAPASDLWILTHPDLRQTPRVRTLLNHLAATIGVKRASSKGTPPAKPPRSAALRPRRHEVPDNGHVWLGMETATLF
jgi:DNA-binding transcriptional LysR family regulator